MTEHPKQNAAPEVSEKLSDISNISIISNGFQNIADKYLASQKTNPKGARELALKHLQELKDSLGKYKEMPNGKKLMAEYAANGMGSTPQALILSQTETNIHDVQILLEGTDTRAILNIIDEHNTGTGSRLPFVLQFLPEEYTKDGKLTEKTLKQAKIEGTSRQMNEFLNDKQSKHIPFFDSDVFEKYPDIIEKALSKPGVILNSYEEIRGFDSNEEFAKMFNRILAREYPDFFGKAQKTKWYNDGGIDIEKMTILLDIVKYRPPERQKHFIDMMDGLENGEAERAVDIYQEYFIGTEIGREIPIRFAHSGLQSHLKKDTLKTLEKHEQGRVEEGSIYHIINTNKKVRNRAAEWFSTMPKNTLEIFLSHLPEIETHCSTGNMEALIKSMDSLQVDIVYKIPFLWGLAEIKSGSGADKNKDRDVEFYLKMAEHYKEQTDVTEENEKLSEQKLKYSIISKAFSGSGPEKQKQKNADFEKFLDETIEGNQYKFNVTTLKDKLRKIFSGTPEAEEIFKKIEASKDGKEIFKILSEAYTEQKSQQSAELRNDGFDGKKWEIFQKRNPKESRDILGKLKNPSMSTEEKIRILRDFIDPTKIPKDATEKELFINSIIVKLADFSKTTKKTEIVSEEHFKDFSASWQSGDFTAFNKKTQEREEKKEKEEEMRKQQEPKQWERNTGMDSASSVDFRSIGTDFAKRPDGQVIRTFVGENEVIIKKDSDNEISIYSGGIPIREIRVSENGNIKDSIQNAMSSIQFLRKYGLGIFRDDIPTIVELINNRPLKNNISLSDGIDPEEELTLLESIAKLAEIEIPEGKSPAEKLSTLKDRFHAIAEQNGKLTSMLRAKGYIQAGSNSVNRFALKNGTEKML